LIVKSFLKRFLRNKDLYVFLFFSRSLLSILNKIYDFFNNRIFGKISYYPFDKDYFFLINEFDLILGRLIYLLQKPSIFYIFLTDRYFKSKFFILAIKFDLFINYLFAFLFSDLYGLRLYNNLFYSIILDRNEGEDFLK